ncbi:MAG: hypothetical protein ACT4P4_17275 [Betaproteobacteria bacterium]
MATATAWLIVFLLLATASLAGIFLYGWYRRKEEMPDVPPLPPEDDDRK